MFRVDFRVSKKFNIIFVSKFLNFFRDKNLKYQDKHS